MSLFYRSVLMSSFVFEKENLRHTLLFLFNQKKKAVESHRFLVEISGKYAPSIKTCVRKFKRI